MNKNIKLTIMACLLVSLSACVTKPVSPELLARQERFKKLQYNYLMSECSIADKLNQNRRSKRPAEDIRVQGDCRYYASKGKVEGYKPMSAKIPTIRINAIPLPFHEMKVLQENIDHRINTKRAASAQIPPQISSMGPDAQIVFQHLIYRGYREDELSAIINSPDFKQAVVNYHDMNENKL